MSSHTLGLTVEVASYLQQHSVHEVAAQQRLRAYTQTLPGAGMQISPEQGQLLTWLIHLTGAKNVFELGTFTGYSALTMALAVPADGRVITCDIDDKVTQLALPFWQEAGVSHKIEQRIGPGLTILAALSQAAVAFDFVFIDADKANYLAYYQALIPLLAPNGLIAVDNVLWSGRVADAAIQDKQTQAIRAINDFIYTDPRVDMCMLPIGDGLTLVRKR